PQPQNTGRINNQTPAYAFCLFRLLTHRSGNFLCRRTLDFSWFLRKTCHGSCHPIGQVRSTRAAVAHRPLCPFPTAALEILARVIPGVLWRRVTSGDRSHASLTAAVANAVHLRCHRSMELFEFSDSRESTAILPASPILSALCVTAPD